MGPATPPRLATTPGHAPRDRSDEPPVHLAAEPWIAVEADLLDRLTVATVATDPWRAAVIVFGEV